MATRRPAIVWMRGPFPASYHDITIFRGGKADEKEDTWDKNSLYFATKALGNGEKGIGDELRSFKQAINYLKDGVPIMAFPEGARSPDGRLMAFKPGM